jgi:hypothetical protein
MQDAVVNVLLSKTCIIHAMFETASWCTKTTKFMSRTVSAVFIACASLLVCSATLIYYYLEKIKQKHFCIDGNFQRKFYTFSRPNYQEQLQNYTSSSNLV